MDTPTPRYLRPVIEPPLATRKMVFVGGPRQVGKTTLALELLSPRADERHPAYLNRDDVRMRPRIRAAEPGSKAVKDWAAGRHAETVR